VRACDSCYNRLSHLAETNNNNNNSKKKSSPWNSVRHRYQHASPAAAGGKLELFSGASPTSPPQSAAGAAGAVGATMATMSEARARLAERGEKLSKLSERSADLAHGAGEFARLAKQLNKQQQANRWF
jgi:transketolase